MSSKHIAAEVTAALSLICWSLVPVPQVWKNYCAKTTEGLSPFLCIIWTFNGMLIASYAVATGLSGFLVAQPFVTAVFLMTCLFQIGFYDRFKEWKKSAVVVAGVSVTNVGIFLGLVFGLRAALNAGVNLDWFAYITTVVGISGMVPQYYEIYKLQRVLGLSLGLCLLDASGSIFGAISVLIATLPELAVGSFVLYIVYAPFVGLLIPLHYVLEARWRRLHPEDVEAQQVEEGAGQGEVEMEDKSEEERKKAGSSLSEERTLASTEGVESAVEQQAEAVPTQTDNTPAEVTELQ